MRYEAPNETLWAAHLRTGQIDRIGVGQGRPMNGASKTTWSAA